MTEPVRPPEQGSHVQNLEAREGGESEQRGEMLHNFQVSSVPILLS